MNILVTIPQGAVRDSFIPEWAAEKLAALGPVQYNKTTQQLTKSQFIEAIKDVEVCVTGWGTPIFDADVLDAAPKLRVIAHTGGSVQPYVDEAVYQRGITVLSGNAIYARSVAEGVLAYMLLALRQIPKYIDIVRDGGWRTETDTSKGLGNKRIGLVGFGAIARNVLEFLAPFDVEIFVYSGHLTKGDAESLNVKKATLEEIFTDCDIISLHSAQRKENEKMINETLLSMIKPGALFINTARGSIVDEEALIGQLETRRFSAVLDVFCQEPLPADSPFRSLDNVISMPHMAGPTTDLRPYVTSSLADDIARFMANENLQHEIPWSYAKNMTTS